MTVLQVFRASLPLDAPNKWICIQVVQKLSDEETGEDEVQDPVVIGWLHPLIRPTTAISLQVNPMASLELRVSARGVANDSNPKHRVEFFGYIQLDERQDEDSIKEAVMRRLSDMFGGDFSGLAGGEDEEDDEEEEDE